MTETARFGIITAKGYYEGTLVREDEHMMRDGYLPRYRGVDGKSVTIVTVQDGHDVGEILAVRDSQVRWVK